MNAFDLDEIRASEAGRNAKWRTFQTWTMFDHPWAAQEGWFSGRRAIRVVVFDRVYHNRVVWKTVEYRDNRGNSFRTLREALGGDPRDVRFLTRKVR